MRRAWKILIGVLAVFVVIVGGGIAYVLNIDANAYKTDIEEAVREETGRQLTINGSIELDIGGETVFRISDVEFANADWGSRPQMVTLGEFEAVVHLIPTLFGTPDIKTVRLSGVDVLIETNEAGVSNTTFRKPGAPAEEKPADDEPREIEAPDGAPITIPILRDVQIRDITATVRNAQAGTENTFRLDHLTLTGEGADSPLTLDMQAAFDDLPMVMAGTLGSPAAMQNPDQRWDVDVTGNLAGVDVAAIGGIMEPTTGRGFDVAVSAIGQELAEIAGKLGIDAPSVGPFEVRTTLQGDSDGDLAAEDVIVDIGAPDFIHVTVGGRVGSVTKVAGLDLQVGVEGEEVGNLSPVADRFAGQTIPDMGPFKVGMRVSGGLGRGIALTGLDAAMGDAGLILLSAKGGVADLVRTSGIDITIAARANEIGNLSDIARSYTGQGVPDLGPLDLGARLVGDLPQPGGSGKMAVNDLDFALGREDTVRVTAQGDIADAMNAAGLDVTVTAKSPEIGQLDGLARQFVGQGVPALGPLDARVAITGGMADGLGVSDLDFKLGREDLIRVTAAGGVADVLAQNGIDIDVTANADEVGNLDTLAKTYTGGQGVPDMGPLALSLSVEGGMGDKLSVPTLDLDFGRDETLRLTANGSVEDALKGAGADLAFTMVSPDLSVLSEAAGSPVPAIGPLNVSGTIKAGADEPVTLQPFQAKIGGSDLSGSVTADLREAVPSIVARLTSQNFDTRDLTGEGGGQSGGTSGGSADTGAGAETSGEDDGRVIPGDPLPLDAMKLVNADIQYKAGKLIAAGSEFESFELVATLQDGRFSMDTLKAAVGPGTLEGTISLDGSQTPAPLAIDITGDDMDLGRLGGAAGLKDKLEGPLDLRIDLKGQGNSPREIAAGLNGSFSTVVVDSRVRRKAVEDAMGADMARLADVLFGNQGEWVVVNCALTDYKVTDGLMEANALYIDTDVSTVTGDGEINLKNEEISMGVKPQTGVISIPLLVTGTLGDPSVIPDPGKTLLSVGGALLTGGGLTAALAVLSASLPEDHPCMSSAEAAKQEAAADANKSTGEKALEAPGKALEGAGDAVKGVTDGLNKLFGQ